MMVVCLPSLPLVQLVTHAFRKLLELALRLRIVGVDHEILKVPEAPAQVLEPLALLEEASDLCADLQAHMSTALDRARQD